MIDTRARLDLTDSRYAARRRSCETAVRKLGAGSLRDVPDQPQYTARLGDQRVNNRAEQEQERASARDIWHGEGWVFATPDGQPLNPNTDYHEWKRLLKEAGLREARLHDARHTAATVLLVLRQPTPTVMSLMGWSSESMAARYQHVIDAMRSQVAAFQQRGIGHQDSR